MVPPGRDPYTGGLSTQVSQRLAFSPGNPVGIHCAAAGYQNTINIGWLKTFQLAKVASSEESREATSSKPLRGSHQDPNPTEAGAFLGANTDALGVEGGGALAEARSSRYDQNYAADLWVVR